MYSDNTIWLRVEEVVKKNNSLEVGFIDPMKQQSKFVRVSCSDSEFPRENIYIVKANALRRKKINRGIGYKTETFVLKNELMVQIDNAVKDYTSIIDVKSDKLCDEHRGVPRFEID